ncbi:MAG: cation-transporting P-type ATPase [Polyangiales bacterium]
MTDHDATADGPSPGLTGPDGAQGLTASEAARRLAEVGPNRLERAASKPLWRRFAAELTHLLAVVLWVAAALSLFAGVHDPGSGMTTLALAIVGVIVVNGTFSFWQEYRADRALRSLEQRLPRRVTALRDGALREVDAEQLVPGDLVALEAGDRVPADGRVIEARSAKVDTSTLTGEAVPLSVDVDATPERDDHRPSTAAKLPGRLYAGTALVSGRVKMTVTATGRATRFADIARMAQTTGAVTSPIHREIRRVSRAVTALSVSLGVLFLFIGRLRGLDWTSAALFGIGIIVANVPEGLLPTVTLSLAMSAQRMAKKKALVRHLPAVEALGASTVICTDKTGTLTENRMRLEAWHVVGRGPVDRDDPRAPPRRLLDCAASCHDLEAVRAGGVERALGDPMEVALVTAARAVDPSLGRASKVAEVPFDTRRKRLVTVHGEGDGRVAYVKGALEALLPLATAVEVEGAPAPLDDARRDELLAAERAFGERGLRVLALAYRLGPATASAEALDRDLVLLGLAALRDPPRPEVAAAMSACHTAGIRVVMITGDHPTTAVAIAREIGMVRTPDVVALTGAAVAEMSDGELQLALAAPEVVLSRMAPEDKTRIVLALQRKGDVVAVTGDGVNDAPALRAADVGVAMGRGGTDVAREVADIVLLDDNFATIVAAIEEGRGVYANVRKFLTYILTSNVPEAVPYLAFVLLGVPLPLTIVQILAVDLGTDMVPALGLAAEPPPEDAMRVPPRTRDDRLLSAGVLLRAYLFLGTIEATAAMTAWLWVLRRGGWRFGAPLATSDPLYKSATTACLLGIIVAQVGNVFACRSDRLPLRWAKLLSNRFILAGVAIELTLMLLIAYTPPGNAVFGTAPVDASVWLVAAPFPLLLVLLEEARKTLARALDARKRRRSPAA